MSQFYSFSQLKQLISSTYSCFDFCRFDLNLPLRTPGQCILAPHFIRSESHPSFAVYDDHAFDFSTNTHYSILDLYALYHFGNNDFDSLCKAAEQISGKSIGKPSSELQDTYVAQHQALNNIFARWHQNLLNNPIVYPNGNEIHILDYLSERRISIDTVKALKLGFVTHDDPDMPYMHDRLIIPYFLYDTDNPVYANGRFMAGLPDKNNPKYKKLSLNDSRFSLILKNSVWGVHSQHPAVSINDTRINPNTGLQEKLETHHIKYDFLVISEGTFDTLAFWQEGYQLASSLGCGFSDEQKKELIQECKHYASKGKKVFICLDNDKAGSNGQYNLALLLFKNRIPFMIGQLPRSLTVSRESAPDFGSTVDIKDVSDYYSAGGDLAELLLNAKPGVSILAEHCRNEHDLEALFTETAKLATKSDLQALKNAACNIMDDNGEVEYIDKKTGEVKYIMDKKPRFSRATVNFYFAIACQPLMDYVIADLTTKAHQLMYDTAGQFYEYSAGVWRTVHECIVKRYIMDALGGKINSGKVSNVYRYLQNSLAVENLVFNTKPLWCFKNGTLWIDEPDCMETLVVNEDGSKEKRITPKNFKPSKPDDMSSIQLNFNYKYGAVNHTWLKYISEWMAGQEDKITLLQQMVGYIFYASNTLQKFFYLIGDGANGKSTFLHTLEALFGKQNCSSLQFHRFSSEFDAIALKNSRLNICYDARTELGGAEDVLKAVTSGDTVMAAHKGVDAEAFTTNAKIFVAANKYFSASDVSKGLLRRILFLCFNQDFSGDSQKTNIEDEIKNDPAGLAGVFNWAYDGYKMLKASGKFIETEEQKALVEEFKTQLSPLMVFARECMYPRHAQFATEKVLYEAYSEWSQENGEKKLSRTKFIYEIRQVLRTDGSQITAQRDKESGLWVFKFPAATQQITQESEDYDAYENYEDFESREKVQSKEAPANEESANAHSDVLHDDEGRINPEASAHSKALQKDKRKVARKPEVDIDAPDYVNQDHPFKGWTNREVWKYGYKCVEFISREGAYWKEFAREHVKGFKVYAAISQWGNLKGKGELLDEMLPGYWEFLREEILPNYEIADDEIGTLIPRKKN